MWFLLKVSIPVEAGNAAAKAGKLGATIQSMDLARAGAAIEQAVKKYA